MNFKEWLVKEEDAAAAATGAADANSKYKLVSPERVGNQQSGYKQWRNWQRIRPGMDIANIAAGTIGGGIMDKELSNVPRSAIFQPYEFQQDRNKDFFLIEDQERVQDHKMVNSTIKSMKDKMHNFVLAQYMGKSDGAVPAFWKPGQYPQMKREDAQWLLTNHSKLRPHTYVDEESGVTTVVVQGQFRYPTELTGKVKGDLYGPTQTGIQGGLRGISPPDTSRFDPSTP